MAKAQINFGELSSGGGEYYTDLISPNTSSYTNVPCGFAPKYVILYRVAGNSPAVNYWDVEGDTFVTSASSSFETDNKSSWIPAYVKIGSDGKSIDVKAANSGYATSTRVIIVG